MLLVIAQSGLRIIEGKSTFAQGLIRQILVVWLSMLVCTTMKIGDPK